jgi:hypothetical protein
MRIVTLLLALVPLAAAPSADARVDSGDVLEAATLKTLTGGSEPLVAKGSTVNIVLFWRPGQDASLDTLKQMASCEKLFAGKPVHMVTVVSSSYPAAEVQAAVTAAGIRVPVLVDQGDALYGKLEIRQHPLVLVTDAAGKIALAQPYTRLRYCDVIHAHVRYLLKEIDAAGLQLALNPPAASMPSDDKTAVARRWVIMAKRDLEEKNCARAVTSFEKALSIAPGLPEALAGIQACKGK